MKKSGSWYSYGSTKLGQGRDSVKKIILENPELMDEIETKIRNKVNGVEEAPEAVEAAE